MLFLLADGPTGGGRGVQHATGAVRLARDEVGHKRGSNRRIRV
jgi:hypothetical protein